MHPFMGSLAASSWTEETTFRGDRRVRGPPQVGWVERSETHHRRRSATDGFRCALPILRSLYPSYGQVALLQGVFEQLEDPAVFVVPRVRMDEAVALHRIRRDLPLEIGRASCRERCVSTCRSRWSPYH